jgi:hypothetical protein
VLSCVGRGLGAGLIPRPRSPTKCLKGSISKKKIPTPEKDIRSKEKEEVNLTISLSLSLIWHSLLSVQVTQKDVYRHSVNEIKTV